MNDHVNKSTNQPNEGITNSADATSEPAGSKAERSLRPLPSDTVHRSDTAWAAAAGAYLQAQRGIDAAVAAQLRAKEVLVALTQHPREEGCGVTVTMSQAWREIDNARTTAVLGVDLERRYGKGCVGATVQINAPY